MNSLALLMATLAQAPADPAAFLPASAVPAGWALFGEAQTFGPDNLYEHIDGAAPGYLRYDFRRVTVHALRRGGDPRTEIVVEVYEFGRPLDAFGIYSNERAPGLTFLRLGAEGYCVGPACRFYKGCYYVKLTAARAETGPCAAEALVARAIAKRLRGEAKPPAILAAFPRGGLAAGSERYEGSDLLAHDFLGAGFTADYALAAGKPSKLFFAIKESPSASREAYYSLLAFMRTRGEVGESLPLPRGEARAVRHPFYGPSLLGRSGPLVGGVLRTPDPQVGTALLADLLARLRAAELVP